MYSVLHTCCKSIYLLSNYSINSHIYLNDEVKSTNKFSKKKNIVAL